MSQTFCRHAANALLPWLVRGTLRPEDLEWVRSHVETCPTCASECGELAASARDEPPAGDLRDGASAPSTGGGRWPWIPYALAVALLVPALLGMRWIWLGMPAAAWTHGPGLRPSIYLDLAAGPSRSVEPLKSLPVRPWVESVVIAFLPPLSEGASYTFDLEGPRGRMIVRDVPIRAIDPRGRCAFSFPPSLFDTAGDYAVVVRSSTPLGQVRLYPYPFKVVGESS